MIRIKEIQFLVARHFGLTIEDLLGPKRAAFFSRPRMIAMYLSYEYTNCSLLEVGKQFSGRHHTTVMHAIEWVKTHPRYTEHVTVLATQVQRFKTERG